MRQSAPPIQSPSPEVISGLLEAIESGGLVDGPAFAHDAARQVFLCALIEGGVLVHWNIEPARDRDHAEALKTGYMQACIAMARQLVETQLSPTEIAQLERTAGGRFGHRADH